MVAGQQKLSARVGKDGQVGGYSVGISEAKSKVTRYGPDHVSRQVFVFVFFSPCADHILISIYASLWKISQRLLTLTCWSNLKYLPL